jgi:hypothetical protein
VAPGRAEETPSLQETIDTAMASGVNVSGLWMRATATPLSATTDGMTAAVTVEMAYPAPGDGSPRIEDTLALRIYALDSDAKVKARSARDLRLGGPAPSAEQPVTILIDEAIDLPPQPVTLRIGIGSTALGRAGTVQVPLEGYNADDPLQLSGIAIGVVGRHLPSLNAGAIASLIPFQPVTARAFASGDTLRVFGRAFWRSGTEPIVTVRIVGTPPQQAELEVSPTYRNTKQGAFDVTLPLAQLPSGEYVLEVAARAERGDPVTRWVPFAVR